MRLKFNLIKFLFGLFFAFVAIVAVYQLYKYVYVSAVSEYTTVIECEDTVKVKGYFLRDESVMNSDNSKYIDIVVGSGEKIAKSGTIANVYSTENAAKIQAQIRDLQARINEIKTVASASLKADSVATYDKEIRTDATKIGKNLSDGQLSSAFNSASEFTANVIKGKISKGEITDYSDKLKSLQQEMSVLQSQSTAVTNNITAQNSGYFVNKADGLESSLNMQACDNLTPESFENIKGICESGTSTSGNYIGKLVSGSQWRVCFETQSSKFDRVTADSVIYIRIPSVTDAKIKCNVVQTLKSGDTSYLVLESNVINGDILSQRCCEIDVIIDTYDGLRVDKNAIRKVDGVDGVYVKNNGVLKYCKVDILYIGSTFAVVKYDSLTNTGLQAYDEVIVKGSDLREGKVVS